MIRKTINKMKNRLFVAILMYLSFTPGFIRAQENGSELKLSLADAQEYAIQHNKMVRSAKLDLEAAKLSIWETVSTGLPQVNASAGFTDNLKLMTTLLPGEFFGQPGTKVPVTFGSQYNSNFGMQATQLIFNAPYFVGVETVKLAKKLAESNVQKTELDTKEAVVTAYYLILVAEESLKILDGNITNLNETLKATKAMYSAGMAESTDVDQMMSNVTMIENTRSSMERTIELNYNLLRFQLGVSSDTKINLTETLIGMTGTINVDALNSQDFGYNDNISYKLVAGQEQMSLLALKTQKASVLPTLSGYYSYSKNGMGDKISDLSWFPNSVVGLSLSVPIFASGQRYARIKKAQINLEKAQTTKDMVTDQLLLQEKQLRYNLINANTQYLAQKNNIDVALRVYKSMENKFKQGMASSLELTQSNSLYLQAENNYISSLMTLFQTKLALDKLLNNL
jgi:outer membrane protein